MEEFWDQMVEHKISSANGRSWMMNTFGAMIMDLRDGSYLFLDNEMLHLFPGDSGREEMIWMKGTNIEDILPYVMNK